MDTITTHKMPITVNDLPPEVLSHAIQLAIVPDYILDHSLSRGPFSAWCRNLREKKDILLVCKTWNSAALPILYRDIIIRRFAQLMPLSKVLEDNPGRLARIVRSITVEGFVHRAYFGLFCERLEVIYQICQRLSTLSLKFDLPEPTDTIHVPARATVTHLTLGGTARYTTDILQGLCGSLVSLGLKVELPTPGTEEPHPTISNLCFPKLEVLSCIVHNNSTTQTSVLLHKWSMPSLTTLTIDAGTYGVSGICNSICRQHGKKLKALRVIATHATLRVENSLQVILNWCPNLDYLYVSSLVAVPSFSHPHLKRVDVGTQWSPRGPQRMEYPLDFDFGPFNWDCPKLEPDGVRLFARDLDHIHDPEMLMKITSQLDFQPPLHDSFGGISFENVCICRVTFNRREVHWIHLVSDHSNYSPINRALPLSFEDDEDDDMSWNYRSSSSTSSTDASTRVFEEDVAELLSELGGTHDEAYSPDPDFEEALDLFEDSLACDASDSDLEGLPWQEFVEPFIREDGYDYS
ncbi:hypothetical protein BDN72DRAFT_838796 [Pluteus cervinus]|uniref:Uncharacterized protein n=1 Tax=Pluteus cervinus TaxID=181527 RepID=A0ACD3B017_9AGAR|nr:hypothetical protein BDN72DRAFT_838796 [Pluteus cervinus]